MRILFVSPHPGFGGASSANRNMATMISSLGHDVIYMDEYLPKNIKVAGCLVNRFPIHSYRYIKRNRIRAYFNKNSYDIIFIAVPIMGVYLYDIFMMLKARGVKICFIFHSLSLKGGLMSNVVEYLISLATNVCTHLIFVSNFTLNSWRKYRNIERMYKNSFVIYNAIESRVKPVVKDSPVRNISFVGRLSIEKGPEFFCRVAKIGKSFNQSLKFNVYGTGPLMDYLTDTYGQYVTFQGYEEDISRIYNNTDVLLMTSDFENCPMVILEAASFGIPCVAPYTGGIPEIVKNGKNGRLYHEREEDTILRLIQDVIDNYSTYSVEAYNYSKSYMFNVLAEDWNKVLHQISL